jgi:hypothetical protein
VELERLLTAAHQRLDALHVPRVTPTQLLLLLQELATSIKPTNT